MRCELVRVTRERALDRERGRDRAHRVVLVRDRRAEERHHAVARELIHGALVAVHRLHDRLKAAVHDAVQILGIEARRERGEARDVGEQHGHELALAFERARAS